jgi:hypothetical protein
LQDFTGYLQADAFAGYDGIDAARRVRPSAMTLESLSAV